MAAALTPAHPPPDGDLDTKCERLLRRRFSLPLDFTAEQAIPALCKWGLVARLPDSRLHAQPLPAALAALDAVWDGIYDFPAVREAASSAGRETGGGVGAGRHAAASTGSAGRGGIVRGAGSGSGQAEGAVGLAQAIDEEEDGWQLAAVGASSTVLGQQDLQAEEAGGQGEQQQ